MPRRSPIVLALMLATTAAQAEPLALHVAQARQQFDAQTSKPVVAVELTPESTRDFARFTGENIGQTTLLKVNNRIVASPTIREPIVTGSVLLSGILHTREATEIAVQLRDGKAVIEVERAR